MRGAAAPTLAAVTRAAAPSLAAVVFDFDGTLFDTEWPIFERARAAAAGLGADLTPELWATHAVGVSHGEPWWDDLAPLLGLTIDQAAFDAAVESVTHIPTSRESATVVPGAEALVAELHRAGVPLAVASGSDRGWLEHHLGRVALTDHFAALVGIDHPDVTAGKPAPDLYEVATRQLGIDPARAVAVEDTHRGVDSARAAGMGAVVAVPSRLTAHHDLSGADLVAPALADLYIALKAAGRL